MIQKPPHIWFKSSARRDVYVATDEPSHIHIARPSRLLRPDTSAPRVQPTDKVHHPDIAAGQMVASSTGAR